MPSDKQRKKAAETASANFTKHGLSRHPYYRMWADARRRCRDRDDDGVSMQADWQNDPTMFIAYLETLPPPRPGDSLDRIDPWGNYEEGNLRFANAYVQRMNQKRMLGAAHPATLAFLSSAMAAYFYEEEGGPGCLCPWEAQQDCPCSSEFRWGR